MKKGLPFFPSGKDPPRRRLELLEIRRLGVFRERGAHRDGVRETVGLPGTGMYWMEKQKFGSGGSPAPRPRRPLSLGLFLAALFGVLAAIYLVCLAFGVN
jgi:hypothetical protein